MPTGDFALSIVIYAVSVMIPYKLAQRSNATRFVVVVLIAVSMLGWLGGLSQPLPRFSLTAAIIQIPILAVSVYWFFLHPAPASGLAVSVIIRPTVLWWNGSTRSYRVREDEE